MPLVPGTRLGAYEILAAIGAGGMGEVYRARDTRLDRTVAVKVLPTQVADDPVFLRRFEREARTISALDHPHICALYDIGREQGTQFLVMQYLEGETLADRLAKGPLPIDQALKYAVQIAEALDKAHRQGIVHRDLKPQNVMLTKAGAKLLDFGVAKMAAARIASPGIPDPQTAGQTRQATLTAQGTILGTLPDGRWVAFHSDESGRNEVYVQSYPDPRTRLQVSSGGGESPRWRGDGRELYFAVGGGRSVLVAPVHASGDSLQVGAAKQLFQMEGAAGYDVARDGQRFLMIVQAERPRPEPITVLLNAFN